MEQPSGAWRGQWAAAEAVRRAARTFSIFLDETAFPRSFQGAAHSRRGFHRCKGPNRGAVIGPLGTEIGAAHDRFATAKLVGEFGLETSKHRLGFGRAAFGGHCDRVAPASLRSGCRTRGQTGARRRRPRRTVIRNERQRPPRPEAPRWQSVLLRVPLPLHQERADFRLAGPPLRHSALPVVIWRSRLRYRFFLTRRSD